MNRPLCFFQQPSAEVIREFLAAQREAPFSYAERGASRFGEPLGYSIDHNRVRLGTGDAVFAAACDAVRSWRMFPAPWTFITPAEAAIVEGTEVAMCARALGLWWLNACRIVQVIDEAGPVRRFGFAYGTLRAHVEQGEEQFSVEQREDGAVWYDLRAFSRPRYWPVRLARPLARRLQRRFVRESQAAMRATVAGGAA